MGTNVIGHFLLIQLLLPMLQQSSRANPEDPSRLLCLSSAGHAAAPLNPDWTRFRRAPSQGRSDGRASESLPTGRQYEKWREYGLTKWAAIAITRRVHWEHGPRDAGFARPKRLVAQQSDREGEIVAVGIHPGQSAGNRLASRSRDQAWLPLGYGITLVPRSISSSTCFSPW